MREVEMKRKYMLQCYAINKKRYGNLLIKYIKLQKYKSVTCICYKMNGL